MKYLLLLLLIACIPTEPGDRTDSEVLEELSAEWALLVTVDSSEGVVHKITVSDWNDLFLEFDNLTRFSIHNLEEWPPKVLRLSGSPSLSFINCSFDRFPLEIMDYEGDVSFNHRICALSVQQMAWIQENNFSTADDNEVRFCLNP